jgi:dihydroxyacetone kinase-like predicted kinase
MKVENMREQFKEKKPAPVVINKKYGFVSVAAGEGLAALFKDMGVDVVVEGGQTMNPSTQDLMDAVYRTPASTVFILPNNKNIAMVAKAASELVSERRVVVLPTVSVPEGLAALINYNPDADEDENVAAMTAAAERVTTMAITYSVRDTKVGRFKIAKGQYLGLVENTIACVSPTPRACAEELTRGMVDAAIVTVLYGEGISEEEAESVGEYVRAHAADGCEVSVMSGGQPIYDYLFWVEQ